jgi:hypothetical protein
MARRKQPEPSPKHLLIRFGLLAVMVATMPLWWKLYLGLANAGGQAYGRQVMKSVLPAGRK